MKKYMKQRNITNWDSWSQSQVKQYIFARITKILSNSTKTIKPYVIRNKRHIIERIFNSHAPKAYIKYKHVIKHTTNSVARTYYEKTPTCVGRKHARTVDIHTINRLAEDMFEGDEKEIQCALVMLFTHYTGCRTSEVLKLQWQDWETQITKHGKFWTFRIRTSKTNMIPLENEQSTIKLEPSKRRFIKQFQKYYSRKNKPQTGYIFDQKWGKTTNINYQLKKVCKKFNISPPISAHSGRNFCLQQ